MGVQLQLGVYETCSDTLAFVKVKIKYQPLLLQIYKRICNVQA